MRSRTYRSWVGSKEQRINLEHAIGGERYEHTEMYPSFIITAKNESNKAAERTFTLANKVEQIHEGKFQTALQAVRTGKDLPKKKLFVCPVCGNIEEGEAPEHCAVCERQVPRSKRSTEVAYPRTDKGSSMWCETERSR